MVSCHSRLLPRICNFRRECYGDIEWEDVITLMGNGYTDSGIDVEKLSIDASKFSVCGWVYGGRLDRRGPVPKLKIENRIPYTYSQTNCTFAARNRDYPVLCAYEIHA